VGLLMIDPANNAYNCIGLQTPTGIHQNLRKRDKAQEFFQNIQQHKIDGNVPFTYLLGYQEARFAFYLNHKREKFIERTVLTYGNMTDQKLKRIAGGEYQFFYPDIELAQKLIERGDDEKENAFTGPIGLFGVTRFMRVLDLHNEKTWYCLSVPLQVAAQYSTEKNIGGAIGRAERIYERMFGNVDLAIKNLPKFPSVISSGLGSLPHTISEGTKVWSSFVMNRIKQFSDFKLPPRPPSPSKPKGEE
jgi:hypothetical protein